MLKRGDDILRQMCYKYAEDLLLFLYWTANYLFHAFLIEIPNIIMKLLTASALLCIYIYLCPCDHDFSVWWFLVFAGDKCMNDQNCQDQFPSVYFKRIWWFLSWHEAQSSGKDANNLICHLKFLFFHLYFFCFAVTLHKEWSNKCYKIELDCLF